MSIENTEILEALYLDAEKRLLVRNKEEFAKAIGYSRSRLHIKMSKNDINNAIIDKAREFVNKTENVIPKLNDDQKDFYRPGGTVMEILAINRTYADAQLNFSEAQRNFSDAHKKAIDTNAILANLLNSKQATVNDLQQKQQDEAAKVRVLQELLLEVGVGKSWSSKREGQARIHKMFSSAALGESLNGTHENSDKQNK